jgi:hypothetical protein
MSWPALVYAAEARCRCGAGLARPALDPSAEWSCVALLRGWAAAGLHDTRDPLLTWIPAERPSSPGSTTRDALLLPTTDAP